MAKAKYRIEGEDATGAAFRSVLGNAKSTADKMSGVFRSAFVGISFAGIANIGRQAIEAGDDLEKFRVKARLSAESASSLAYAAKLSDVELDGLGTSLQKMQIFLSKAASGEQANVEGLDAIGLKVKTLKGLKADQQFELIAEQIANMRSESDQTRAIVEIFGKSGGALLPMFQDGARGIREAREEAEKLGLLFNEGQLADLSQADDAIKRLDESWEHFAGTLTAKVAPSIAYATDRLSGKPKDIYEQWADQEELVEQLKYARGPNAEKQRAEAARKLNSLKQRAFGQSSRDLGVMPQDAPTPPPPGYKPGPDKAAEAEAKAEKKRMDDYSSAMKGMSDDLLKTDMDNIHAEWDARLENWEIFEKAQREGEEKLAAYREEQAEKEYEQKQQLLDDLAYDLTDALTSEDGFERMLERWAMEWLQSDIRKLLGEAFGGGGGGGGDSLLGSLFGKGSGGSGFMPGEWSHGQGGLGGIFGGLGGLLGFAKGGRPPVGRPSIVGENGPELFMPDIAGTVLPNLGSSMTNHISIHVDNRGGGTSATDARRLGKTLGDAIEDRIITKMRRRGYRLD